MWKNFVTRILTRTFEQKNKKTFYDLPRRIRTQGFSEATGNMTNLSILAAAFGYFTYNIYDNFNVVYAAELLKNETQLKSPRKGRIYTRDEVSRHRTPKERIWVTYEGGVYDITDYIKLHPGGDQILQAAGGDLEPFWSIYTYHKKPENLAILEQYRIGSLDPKDQQPGQMVDPYHKEPIRDPLFIPLSKSPFNGNGPVDLLVESFITPNELFYVRNHLPVPEMDINNYSFEIEIEGRDGITTFTLDDIKKFPKKTITVALMCSGNRRDEMTKVKPVQGLAWSKGAVGNATWSGASLREVLFAAGLTECDVERLKYVQFEGYDVDVTGQRYNGSVPIFKAMDYIGDCILAYEMNGVDLPMDHGYPLRLIAPGMTGARHVKWLAKIIVSSEESKGHWQRQDYKGFSPSTDFTNVDFTKVQSIHEYPINSAICQPDVLNGVPAEVKDGHITVKGYAYSGGGHKIYRVDVTSDCGKTWHEASLDHYDCSEYPRHWGWTLWSCKLPVPPDAKKVQVWAKAVNSSFNCQPESFWNNYNFRGVLNNAYHRINIKLV